MLLLYYFEAFMSMQAKKENELIPKIERNLKKSSFFLDKEYSIVL